ncbi:MAG: hypothetical protein R3Y68_01515 [Rikenellaceae bacterium]
MDERPDRSLHRRSIPLRDGVVEISLLWCARSVSGVLTYGGTAETFTVVASITDSIDSQVYTDEVTVTVSDNTLTLADGIAASYSYEYSATPTDLAVTLVSNKYTDADIAWSSSAPEIVSVSNGALTINEIGTATITAKVTDNLSVTSVITATYDTPTSIAIDTDVSKGIASGKSENFSATITGAGGASGKLDPALTVTWTATEGSFDGSTYTASAVDTTTSSAVTATVDGYNSVTTNTTFNITADPTVEIDGLETLEFTYGTDTTHTRTAQQYNTTEAITWSVTSGDAVSVVEATGVVTIANAETAVVTATCDGATDTITINVEVVTSTIAITNDAISDGAIDTNIGLNLTFTATIDAETTKSDLQWSISTDSTLATLTTNDDGSVTVAAISVGTETLTVTDSVSGETDSITINIAANGITTPDYNVDEGGIF